MKPKQFIEKVRELYLKARFTTILEKNIKRGRSHSISSEVEDLFGFYIAQYLPETVEILIDQPISYKITEEEKEKTYTLYPDITLIEKNCILNFFDVKMDLGWNRNFGPYCVEKQDLIDDIRELNVKIKDGGTKEERYLIISDKAKYNIVIISDENISKEKRNKNIVDIKKLDKNKIQVFVLTSGCHPNTYDELKLVDIKVNTEIFINLNTEISNSKNNIKSN